MTADILSFLAQEGPCFDVRSPGEYLHASIPGAINLPLFSDEERAQVGTAYKRESRDVAIRLGVKIVGPKLDALLKFADTHAEVNRPLRLYCWRGGMRSGFVSYFLHFTGYSTLQLKGGYKAFRRFALEEFTKPNTFFCLGGLTGSGKTEILSHLQKLGEPVVDLEALAAHRGSVYGDIVGKAQPTNEQFENELALTLFRQNRQLPIWIEDESRLIGRCQVPGALYEAKKRSKLFVIQVPKEERLQRILQMYAACPPEYWKEATLKIQKRLGGLVTQKVLECIEKEQITDAFTLLLDYYDRAYEYAISRHMGPVVRLQEKNLSVSDWAKVLMEHAKNVN